MRVLIPVDHPVPTRTLLERCLRFADAGPCTVVLAHVAELGDAADQIAIRAYLAGATQALRQAGLDAMYVVRDGAPSVEIARLAHELDAHLLIPA